MDIAFAIGVIVLMHLLVLGAFWLSCGRMGRAYVSVLMHLLVLGAF